MAESPAVSRITVCVCAFSLKECNECHEHKEATAVHPAPTEPMKERPVEEVAARLAQQEQEEQDISACRTTTTHKRTKSDVVAY